MTGGWPGAQGGSGLSCPSGHRRFWADSGPDPGGKILFIVILRVSDSVSARGPRITTPEWSAPDEGLLLRLKREVGPASSRGG